MKNKDLPSLKATVAKKMVSGKKFMERPPHTPRNASPNADKPSLNGKGLGRHGSYGKNLTEQKNKHFNKFNRNSSFGKKVREEEAGWENH